LSKFPFYNKSFRAFYDDSSNFLKVLAISADEKHKVIMKQALHRAAQSDGPTRPTEIFRACRADLIKEDRRARRS
jgi:hypothetical protein